MFTGIAGCSRDYLNFSRIVCTKHANDVFNLAPSVKTVHSYRKYTTHTVTWTSPEATQDSVPLLPFPFKFDAAASSGGSTVHGSYSICIDKSIVQAVASFISSKNLTSLGYSSQQRDQIIGVIVSYIQEQPNMAPMNPDANAALNFQFQLFAGYQKLRLENHWSKPQVNLKIVNDDDDLISFPISKLPIFYQAMLVNFEVAEHKYTSTTRPNVTILPNILCSAKAKNIITLNQSPDLEICRNVNGATYSSPLVLCGYVNHTNLMTYEPFQRPSIDNVPFLTSHTHFPMCP